MTGDLVAWLTRVWDEEERTAKEAAEGPWDLHMHSPDMAGRHGWDLRGPRNLGPQGFVLSTRMTSGNAHHIASHDPASVLARIAADRKILALADEASALDAQVDGEFRVGPRNLKEEPYVGDLILRHLASPYKGREGWQEEWE